MKKIPLVLGLSQENCVLRFDFRAPMPFELYEVVESDKGSRWMVASIEPAIGAVRFWPFSPE